MKIISLKELSKAQSEAIFHLWNNEYPRQLAHTTIEQQNAYLDRLEDKTHFLLLNNHNEISGWGLVFSRDGEKWFAMMISEKFQRQGFGTKLLTELKKGHQKLNGWVIEQNDYTKICGEKYTSPINFYLQNNFKLLKDIRFDSEQISVVKIQWTR